MCGRTSNVTKLPVLEDDELLAPSNLSQASDGLVREVFDDICMRLQHANLISHILGQSQQLGRGRHICGYTKIGSLHVNESQ